MTTPSALAQRIQNDVKDAMRAKDQKLLTTLRLLTAAIKQKEVDERIVLEDQHIISIVEKMIKQRRESIAQYETAARADLVAQEQFELDIIKKYLPEQLSEAEVVKLIQAAIASTEAKSIQDMGKVMAILKPQLQGKADMGMVSQKIKEKLS